MKLAMFHEVSTEPPVRQSAHLLWPDRPDKTLCGLDYPGVLGVPKVVTGEALHLCGRCESVVTFEGRHLALDGDVRYSKPDVWTQSRKRQDRRNRLHA